MGRWALQKNNFEEGVVGFYRGGLSAGLGGALFRSAQFGVYQNALEAIRPTQRPQQHRTINLHVVAAGFAVVLVVASWKVHSSTSRFVAVEEPWKLRDVYKGSAATVFRNAFLFSSLNRVHGPQQ